jgi:hypothetical protein
MTFNKNIGEEERENYSHHYLHPCVTAHLRGAPENPHNRQVFIHAFKDYPVNEKIGQLQKDKGYQSCQPQSFPVHIPSFIL